MSEDLQKTVQSGQYSPTPSSAQPTSGIRGRPDRLRNESLPSAVAKRDESKADRVLLRMGQRGGHRLSLRRYSTPCQWCLRRELAHRRTIGWSAVDSEALRESSTTPCTPCRSGSACVAPKPS